MTDNPSSATTHTLSVAYHASLTTDNASSAAYHALSETDNTLSMTTHALPAAYYLLSITGNALPETNHPLPTAYHAYFAIMYAYNVAKLSYYFLCKEFFFNISHVLIHIEHIWLLFSGTNSNIK